MLKFALKNIFLFTFLPLTLWAQLVSEKPTNFELSNALIYVDSNEHTVVLKSAKLLQNDIQKVTGKSPRIVHTLSQEPTIVIGSIDKSEIIQHFIKTNILSNLSNWEEYEIKRSGPYLIIAGADRRATAFGIFELSKQMGVSPWYWWVDVPVEKKDKIYISAQAYQKSAPKVKYRGIFINDEAPSLSSWSKEKFGGFNHLFYSHVFELLLRLKSNYIWPAMWGSAFYDDDPLNQKIAEDYAIVIGTSHHEPMNRAHDEWRRYGKGVWNYDQNATALQHFWKEGMLRAQNEKLTTIGMRGDGDEPMTRETATQLLEKIVADQRKIISEVSQKPAEETPQVWALYKEVQDYYDKGMRVPDDVTLLLCDDNWGNLRKLPALDAPPRKGGYGIYYHFDYVGGPRNHKWINTTSIMRVWEQMNLAYTHGVKDIWIVNVGDIKPMEFPISFWAEMAWNPENYNPQTTQLFAQKWASEQFGQPYSSEIGKILTLYTQYNSRRKPELLDHKTYSLNHYNEFQIVVQEYQNLLKQAKSIQEKIPSKYHNAYFQLVLHPVKAMANLYDLYYAVAKNHEAYQKQASTTNYWAQKAKDAFLLDSLITVEYHTLNQGKWNHMMSQTHIGYTSWQQPEKNIMPKVYTLEGNSTLEMEETPIMAPHKGKTYIEKNAYVSILADKYTKAYNTNGLTWTILPYLGKTGHAITTLPANKPEVPFSTKNPYLEYVFETTSTGPVTITAYFSPSLNFHFTENGLQYGISLDHETPQILSLNKEDKDSISGIWNKWVAEGIIKKQSQHQITKAGKHSLKYWMVNNGVVLQKIVIDFGGVQESYLGPPPTFK